ncbi:MAG: NRDE family protein [Limisphaerales bacterium]
MCTVTFSPRKNGYALAMNRDESLTRPEGLPPSKKNHNGCEMIYPSEPNGGTWISANQNGVCFALINWYSIAARVKGKTVSRGEIIKNLGAIESPAQADDLFGKYPLHKTNRSG